VVVVEDERATEVGELSQLVMEICIKIGLIVERLREVHAYDAGPWD
jgi:hypothetical protein